MSLLPGDRLAGSLDVRTVAVMRKPIEAGTEMSRLVGGVSGKGMLTPPARGRHENPPVLLARRSSSQQRWPMMLGIDPLDLGLSFDAT